MTKPTYTSELPTEPGWYSLADTSDTPADIVADGLGSRDVEIRGVENSNMLIVLYPRCYYYGLQDVGGKWAGPIPEPEQDESENDDE